MASRISTPKTSSRGEVPPERAADLASRLAPADGALALLATDQLDLTPVPAPRHSRGAGITNETSRVGMKKATARKVFGRGRPSIERASAIDSAILSAAKDLFLRDGFDGVTMEAVAIATPLSKTTLYSRFASKEILLAAVIHDRIQQWSKNASQNDIGLPDDIGERLKGHARTMAQAIRQPEVLGFTRLSFLLTERFPEMARLMYKEGYLLHVAFIRGEIEAAAARDGRPVRDAEAVAKHFVNSIAGWNIQENPRGDITLEEAVACAERSAELILAARDHW